MNDVRDLGLRCPVDASHVRSLQRPTEEDANFEEIFLRTHKKVAGFTREHDRFVRGVNPLIPEGSSGLAQPVPCVPQIFREVLDEGRFGRCPTVVLFSLLNPLFAVIALSTRHAPIVVMIPYEVARFSRALTRGVGPLTSRPAMVDLSLLESTTTR